jgi:hypothetical protein
LLSGDYFTYFVDLNADKTGNIFLNRPNDKPPKDTQADSKNTSTKESNSQQESNQQSQQTQ